MTRLPSGPFAVGDDLTVPLSRTVESLSAGIPIENINRVGRVEREIGLALDAQPTPAERIAAVRNAFAAIREALAGTDCDAYVTIHGADAALLEAALDADVSAYRTDFASHDRELTSANLGPIMLIGGRL